MFILFLPSVLLLKRREPAEGERGKSNRPFVWWSICLPLDQLFLPMFAQITEMYSELEEGQTMVNPLQLASMLVDWMDPEKAVYVPPFYAFENLFTISTGRSPAAERMTVSTSILLRTLSKPCLMTTLHVRKNSPFPALFLSTTSLLMHRREQEDFLSTLEQAPAPGGCRRK